MFGCFGRCDAELPCMTCRGRQADLETWLIGEALQELRSRYEARRRSVPPISTTPVKP
jgi:hypothetical protein